MEKITTVGVDLAKVVFTVHGVDAAGRTVLRKTVRREKLMELITSLPPCLIGMEACAGAHEWARRFIPHGHRVGIMMARFVKAYRKSSKNDRNDAEAICEAVGRPNMRFVPVKSAEQQAILALHRVREGFIEERTATINRIRGLLGEFGVVLPQRAEQVRRGAVVAAEALPVLAREAVADLRAHLRYLDARINHYERQLLALTKTQQAAQRLQGIPGVGLGHHRQHRQWPRIRQCSPVRGVARSGAATIFHRWQSEAWTHHQTRRCLSAYAADARCACCAAERSAEN